MSTRDELEAALISGFAIKNAVWVENDMPCLRLGEVADYLLSQGWRPPMRVIETVEELEALPKGTAILDREEDMWVKDIEDMWCFQGRGGFESDAAVRKFGPFRMVWEPEQ